MTPEPRLRLDPARLDAAVFDLDGVLADTARLHAAAWKAAFDALLAERGDPRPFGTADYHAHVDGRPRLEGVRAFLASRWIELPEGGPDDPEDAWSVLRVGARKNAIVQGKLAREARALPGAAALLRALGAAGVRVAVASSSANAEVVLEATGLAPLAEVRVDGRDLAAMRRPGKPDPALFLEALRRLGAEAARAAVFEDALAGVEAGRRAGFAQVIGVGPEGRAQALRARGASAVVGGLHEVGLA